MAVRKTNNQKTGQGGKKDKNAASGKKPIGVIFWLGFFILIAGLFLYNRDRIRETLESTQILTWLSLPFSGPGKSKDPEAAPAEDAPDSSPPAAPKITVTSKPASSPQETPVKPADKPQAVPPAQPAAPASASPAASPSTPAATPAPARPAAEPASSGGTPATPAGSSGNSRPAAAERERTLYFTQVDSAGTILRTKVTRKIPASDSPMVDSLQALLAGPNAEEQRRGMVSLIPRGVRILSATVRGSTAYVSFSEEFQFNTKGVDGYAAQLRQIVWTATEFPNVKDVQVLIEGNRVDYLGEGIWIGSPISRESL